LGGSLFQARQMDDKNTFEMDVIYVSKGDYFKDNGVGVIGLRDGYSAFENMYYEFSLMFSKMK
jgi:hypothetical protein